MLDIDITQIDLNLLVALEVLLHERNVTRAARRLHRTQSAVSHALGRLREQLQDPLLIRSGREMSLTPKAEQLAVELPRIMRALTRVLRTEDASDPAQSDRAFVFGAPDFASALLPDIVRELRARAPAASVEFVVTDDGIEHELAEGRIDLCLGSALPGGQDYVASEALPGSPWVVFARAGHPAIRAWSRTSWLEWPHVVVRRGRAALRSVVDLAARREKVTRRVGAYVPQFVHALPLVAATDLLIAAPAGAFADLARTFNLVALELPVHIEPIEPRIHFLRELSGVPALAMFREVVYAALSTSATRAKSMRVVPVRRSPALRTLTKPRTARGTESEAGTRRRPAHPGAEN